MDSDWKTLSWEEKRARRFEWYSSTEGISFVSPQAEAAYRARAQRMIDVYHVREPDKVPVSLPIGSLPVEYAGIDYRTAMYDAEKAAQAWLRFSQETDLDTFAAPNVPVGKVLDLLDFRLYRWPGHGLAGNAMGYQFVEGEYMTATSTTR